MSEQDFFKSALADFTFEAASGGAVRHLADLGYTVKQITEQIAFPTPYERVRKTVRERLLETGVLLLEEPGSAKVKPAAYVTDYDKYGRVSFRKERIQENPPEKIFWKERIFDEKRDGRLARHLVEKCTENGEENSYVFCDFGVKMEKEPALSEMYRRVLDERAADYIFGLFKGQGNCYHRLNGRMREIVNALWEKTEFNSECYFIKTKEKIVLQRGEKNEQSN